MRLIADHWRRQGTPDYISAVTEEPEDGGFALLAAHPLGPWRQWGRLTLGAELDGEGLRFAPTVGAPDLQPVGLFRTLRAWSYDASQAARETPDAAPALRVVKTGS